jgi:hypothetical protein
MQEAAEHMEGQKKWLLSKVLQQEMLMEEERQDHEALEAELDGCLATNSKLSAKVSVPRLVLLTADHGGADGRGGLHVDVLLSCDTLLYV